jgi:hypothetical protein
MMEVVYIKPDTRAPQTRELGEETTCPEHCAGNALAAAALLK